jgi:hypothetical protein
MSTLKSLQRENYKGKVDMNNTVDQVDLTDIYRTFHPTAVEWTYFLAHTEYSPG